MTEETAVPQPVADYGMFLLAIPAVATLLIWFWVSSMNLLQSPQSAMGLIMLATVLGTAAVAAMEASKVGMKTNRKQGTYGPTAWFFIIVLLWIVGYPTYLYRRRHYGLASRLAAGIVLAAVFTGSFSIMNVAIEEQKAEIRQNIEDMQHEFESGW